VRIKIGSSYWPWQRNTTWISGSSVSLKHPIVPGFTRSGAFIFSGLLKKSLKWYFAEVSVEGLFGVDALNEVERKRVRQRRGRVYFDKPFKRYISQPPPRLLGGSNEPAAKTAYPGGKETLRSEAEASAATAKSVSADYPFAKADLHLRADSLREALDLQAAVLRVE
jgi:hypothetical protein